MNVLAFGMILGGVLLRLIPHIPNFAPITGMALFGGVYLNRKYALIMPLLTMLISDYFIGFHSTMIYVYTSFLISGLIGLWLKKRRKPSNIILGSFLASLQFFLITNFGVWAGGAYSRGLDGLAQSYIMGLPFLKWTLLGDLFYTGVFFASYEWALRVAKYRLTLV